MAERIRWRWPKGTKAWILVFVVFILAFAASQLVPHLANTPGFVPPDWWPAGSDPRVEIDSAADAFPDISLQGNYLFLLVATAITLIFNIFGEEIYYRGYLLPRMRGAFGRWDWVANGVLFTLKHVYQRWLYPGILVGGLAFAFAAGPLGGLPLAMIYHYVGAELIGTVFLIMATLGLG
jgi:membrane protease YdiL (CAAX protease family)